MKQTKACKTIVIAAGGTSGHIYPALSIADKIGSRMPDYRLIFCGVPGNLEQTMVEAEGYEFQAIAAQNMPSKQDRRYLSWIVRNVRGLRLSLALLKKERPALVIGTGGFVSAPLVAAARFLKIPYMLHEQNSVPGRANRLFAKKAHTVFISYETSRDHFADKVNLTFSGNPVRSVFQTINRASAREALNIQDDAFLVFVMGGSLGSRTLNTAVARMDEQGRWSQLMHRFSRLRIAISTGVQSDKTALSKLSIIPGMLRAESFLNDAPLWIAACDLFVGRAGAMTCAEIASQGKPSILVPFPFAADDHQTENARAMKEAGASIVFDDRDFNSDVLLKTVEDMIKSPERLQQMGENARHWSTPNAADEIADKVMAVIKAHETAERS